MITSKTCELAIRALIIIAQDTTGQPVRISKLHEDLEIGFSFMTKILQPLTHAGILISLKGAKGGMALARKADEINLKQVVLAIDGDSLFTKCSLGFPTCSDPNKCEFHDRWVPVRELLTNTFEKTSIADLVISGYETLLEHFSS